MIESALSFVFLKGTPSGVLNVESYLLETLLHLHVQRFHREEREPPGETVRELRVRARERILIFVCILRA